MKFARFFGSTALFLALFTAAAAHAAPVSDAVKSKLFANSDVQATQGLLNRLQKAGSKLTYIGGDAGLEGYLVEAPSGQLQTIYVAPDGKMAVAGVLYNSDGINITARQLALLRQKALSEGEAPNDASVPTLSSGDVASANSVATGKSETLSQSESPSSVYKVDLPAKMLVDELNKARWFSLGPVNAPVVWMVADPQCPYCHKAWEKLYPEVAAGRIQLRVILIAFLSGSNDKALSLLSKDDPGKAWLAGQGSKSGASFDPAPKEGSDRYALAKASLKANEAVAEKLKVKGTPYLVYVTQDDDVYEVRGLPPSLETFLAGLK